MKQPDLALAEIARAMDVDDPARASRLRELAREVLAIGGFGVFPNVAGFTTDISVPLPDALPRADSPAAPAPAATRMIRVVVPVAVTGGTYGDVGVNLYLPDGARGSGSFASVPLSDFGAQPRELAVELSARATDCELGLSVWHRGNGTVHFGAPRVVAPGAAERRLAWRDVVPAALTMPTVQSMDHDFHVDDAPGGLGDLVVAALPALERTIEAADRVVALVAEYLAAHPDAGAEEHLWLPQLARLVQQAAAWRTIREPNRDFFLEANALWLTNEAFSDRQVVVVAHSVHVDRIPGRMGALLAAAATDYLTVSLLARSGQHRYWEGSADLRALHPGGPLPVHEIAPSPWSAALAPLSPRGLPAFFDLRQGRRCLDVPSGLWEHAGRTGSHDGLETSDLMVVIDRLAPAVPITSVRPATGDRPGGERAALAC